MKQNMTNKMPKHRRNARRGVALIEAMISIIVLGIGVLGVLGLQLRTMVESQQSANRALAVRLAEDFSERLKNNPDAEGLLANNINLAADNFITGSSQEWISRGSTGLSSTSSTSSITTSPGNNCTGGCANEELAAQDRFQWLDVVVNTLPNAQVSVFMSTNEQIGILFAWDGNMRMRNDDPDAATAGNYRAIYGGVAGQNFETGGGAINCPPPGNPELVCHLVYISY